ncbi:MAG: PorV/PorQ family protein [Elusimicrobia bacterium]|nr:PorV/PorQ family protein [Elusimicrobiota bacterium]
MARLRRAAVAVVACVFAAAEASAGVFPTSPFSDKAAGTTGAAFLKTPPSARANALADAHTAGADGSEALFWNPAGIASLEDTLRSDASLGYNALLETAYQSSLAYARPIAGRGVVGAGLLYASQGSQQGYSTVGDPTSGFTPNDLAFTVGYGKKLDVLRLGAGLKLVRSQLSDASGTTFALDFGAQYLGAMNTSEGPIDLGVSVQNLGPGLSMGSSSDPLPFKLQLGARWHISDRIAGVLDGIMPVDQDPAAALGVEGRFPVGENIAASIRGGYNVARTRGVDGLTGLAAGFGLEWNQIRLDYAWVPYGDLGATNRITFGYAFDTVGRGRAPSGVRAARSAAPAPLPASSGPLAPGSSLSELERSYWTAAIAWVFQSSGGGRPFNPQLEEYPTGNGASTSGGGFTHIIGIVPAKETLLLYESDCDLTKPNVNCGAFTGMVFEVSSRDAGVELRGAHEVLKGKPNRLQPAVPGVRDSFLAARRFWLEKGRDLTARK